MTDPPIDHTQAREQDAPGTHTHDAKRQAPVHVHGHTGDVPSDKALSDTGGVLGFPIVHPSRAPRGYGLLHHHPAHRRIPGPPPDSLP
eukprot:scaffold3550_cov112-Isochrysis_galbana.AAC.9